MERFSIMFLLGCLITMAFTRLITAEPAHKPIKAFLLAGQGNMVGHGGFVKVDANVWDHKVPLESRPTPAIQRLDENNQWVQAEEPLHKGIFPEDNEFLGVGPGLPFAHKLLQLKPQIGTIGLVPCARDDSSLKTWLDGELSTTILERSRAAESMEAEIAGLLWWQGGEDAKTLEEARAYRDYQAKFFDKVRSMLPKIPIIMVIIPSGKRPYSRVVREAQSTIQLENLVKLDEDKLRLPTNEDGIHISTEGQVILGAELAKAYASAFAN